ncbi:hypothetical protein ACHQM5_004581 [Ranunculus cassubicifolius]
MCEEAIGPAFFKIIHPRFNTTQQLRLPPAFLKYNAKDENEMAFLQSPISKHCYVKVLRTVDGVFLQDGLQKFLKDHSLGNYEFLVFNYQGNMKFTVRIFDMSGCEKQYKLKEPAKKRGRPPKKLDRIPRDFADMHISKSKEVVVLWNQSGKSWNVNFNPLMCAFCGGWPAFLHDNEIEQGNNCVFELVGHLEFCVHFFPKVK